MGPIMGLVIVPPLLALEYRKRLIFRVFPVTFGCVFGTVFEKKSQIPVCSRILGLKRQPAKVRIRPPMCLERHMGPCLLRILLHSVAHVVAHSVAFCCRMLLGILLRMLLRRFVAFCWRILLRMLLRILLLRIF